MASITWDAEVAGVYDETYAAMFDPSVLGPVTAVLAELAGGGPALEFASGTGRVALALSARGVPVRGLELSRPMAARTAAKAGAGSVPVTQVGWGRGRGGEPGRSFPKKRDGGVGGGRVRGLRPRWRRAGPRL